MNGERMEFARAASEQLHTFVALRGKSNEELVAFAIEHVMPIIDDGRPIAVNLMLEIFHRLDPKFGSVDRDTPSNLVTLADCPPGLFRFNGELCFKSEYRTSRENGTSVCDAYVVASGEYFWGGTSVDSQREALKVQPVASPLFPEGVFKAKDGNYYRVERVQPPTAP
jgi:hypothetical protein